MRQSPVRPDTREPHPEKTISNRQAQALFLVPALEDEKLMTQGKDFLWCNSRTETNHAEQRARKPGPSSLPRSRSVYRAKCKRYTDDRIFRRDRVALPLWGPSSTGGVTKFSVWEPSACLEIRL